MFSSLKLDVIPGVPFMLPGSVYWVLTVQQFCFEVTWPSCQAMVNNTFLHGEKYLVIHCGLSFPVCYKADLCT